MCRVMVVFDIFVFFFDLFLIVVFVVDLDSVDFCLEFFWWLWGEEVDDVFVCGMWELILCVIVDDCGVFVIFG